MILRRLSAAAVPIGALLLLFVLSGAAGLIYEVVWARQLVLVFGNTSQAVSTILTGFFGGLAIGGFFGGRIADRVVRPLRLYGALELVVVIVVLITPITFRLIGTIYQGIYPSLAESPVLLALVRFVLAILALAPATLLMGATLPTLTRFLTKDGAGIAGAFQKLYAANTLGAIFGTAIAGFVLIELFGLTGALIVGAVCSGTAGLIALLLDRRSGAAAVNPAPDPEPIRESWDTTRFPTEAADRRRRLAFLLAFVSGLTALGYQVVWNRLIGAGTGSSTYVFTIILTLFLIGIALGAGMLGVLRLRVRSTIALIAVAQLLTALFATIGAAILASPPVAVQRRRAGLHRVAPGLRLAGAAARPAADDRDGHHVPRDGRAPGRGTRLGGQRDRHPARGQHRRLARRDVPAAVLRDPAHRLAGDARRARDHQRDRRRDAVLRQPRRRPVAPPAGRRGRAS